LQKSDFLIPFVAGLGVGAAAAVLLAPEAGRTTRNRIGDSGSRAADALKTHAGDLRGAASDLLQEGKSIWRDAQNKRSETMSGFKEKVKEKIDDTADAAKNAAEGVIDKSKDVAHGAGKKLERGGKRLQDA
jgi:gas vesicle protein